MHLLPRLLRQHFPTICRQERAKNLAPVLLHGLGFSSLQSGDSTAINGLSLATSSRRASNSVLVAFISDRIVERSDAAMSTVAGPLGKFIASASSVLFDIVVTTYDV